MLKFANCMAFNVKPLTLSPFVSEKRDLQRPRSEALERTLDDFHFPGVIPISGGFSRVRESRMPRPYGGSCSFFILLPEKKLPDPDDLHSFPSCSLTWAAAQFLLKHRNLRISILRALTYGSPRFRRVRAVRIEQHEALNLSKTQWEHFVGERSWEKRPEKCVQ